MSRRVNGANGDADFLHISQEHENGCALACIRMVLAWAGREVPFERELQDDLKGSWLSEKGVRAGPLYKQLSTRLTEGSDQQGVTVRDLRHPRDGERDYLTLAGLTKKTANLRESIKGCVVDARHLPRTPTSVWVVAQSTWMYADEQDRYPRNIGHWLVIHSPRRLSRRIGGGSAAVNKINPDMLTTVVMLHDPNEKLGYLAPLESVCAWDVHDAFEITRGNGVAVP